MLSVLCNGMIYHSFVSMIDPGEIWMRLKITCDVQSSLRRQALRGATNVSTTWRQKGTRPHLEHQSFEDLTC